MKGNRALLAGALVGILLGLTAFPAGLKPIEITFAACIALFIFTSVCIIGFSIKGWPQAGNHTDFYDLSRVFVGASFALMALGVVMAASEKLATVLSISQGMAAVFSSLFLFCYCGLAYALLALVSRSKAANRQHRGRRPMPPYAYAPVRSREAIPTRRAVGFK